MKCLTCDLHGSIGHEEDSELELGHKVSILLIEHIEGLQHLVLQALHYSHSGFLFLLAVPEKEGLMCQASYLLTDRTGYLMLKGMGP